MPQTEFGSNDLWQDAAHLKNENSVQNLAEISAKYSLNKIQFFCKISLQKETEIGHESQ